MKIIVDNLAVEYSDQGSGPAIVMLHGWSDNLHTFDKLVSELSGFRVVRLDLPGFGKSERPKDAWDVGQYTVFVRDFLAKLGIEQYILTGHSFGGRIAIKGVGTGVLQPERLVLIASAGVAKERTFKNEMLRTAAKIGKTLTLAWPFSLWRQRIRRKLYERIGSDYFAAGSMRDVFLKTIREDLLGYARGIQIPTLLIWGSEDTSTPLRDGERIHTAILGSELKVIDGASHFVHHEKPEEVAGYIRAFI